MAGLGVVQWALGLLLLLLLGVAHANVQSKVRCSQDTMEVDIVRTTPQALIYLQQLKNYPNEACKPKLSNGIATFKLSLLEKDMSNCGVTRITNKLTGQKVYWHQVIVEEPSDNSKHTFTVKCSITEVVVQQPKFSNATLEQLIPRRRRTVLPEDFEADAKVVDAISQNATEPKLMFNVRQGNKIIKDELVVKPGTPLQMEIYLSEESAKVYGLIVTHMSVSDTRNNEETIIFNGCSVDPFLFENFETVNGDFLSAKFRAFKFPESSYVEFKGTVNVCVGKCRGIECSNGKIGYGRKKRAVESLRNKNEMWEMALSMFIKVDLGQDSIDDEEISKFIRKGKTRERTIRAEDSHEQFRYKTENLMEATGYSSSASSANSLVCLVLAILVFCRIL